MYLREGSAGAAHPLKHAENTCGKALPKSFLKIGLESSSTESSSQEGLRKVGPRMVGLYYKEGGARIGRVHVRRSTYRGSM